ncbi:hypothetical protein [Curvivirga sp.]|uniref:hypothetical protein n=1 Tax=Curvivirga sp. TaxID=2856848 RepID=UPI003B5A5D83
MIEKIAKNAFWLVLSAMILGFFVPIVSHTIRPYTFAFLFGVMLCALMRMPDPDFAHAKEKQKTRMSILIIWQLFLTPAIVWGFCKLAQLPDTLSTALIACACAGPVFSTPAFAKLNNLDAGFTIQNVVISSLLMPISLLVAGLLFLPVIPDIDLQTFIIRVLIFLFLPFVIAYIYRRLIQTEMQQKLDMRLGALTTICLCLMACSLMDGLLNKAINDPYKIASLIVLVISFNLTLQAISSYLFKPMDKKTALNAGLVCGYRNWTLTLAITAGSLGEDFTALVALGQFGVMLLPLPSLNFFDRFIKA